MRILTWFGLFVGVFLCGPVAVRMVAQQPILTGVPSDGIAFFDRTTATGCPSGWAELTGARGAYLVGLVSGGTKGTLVGSVLSDQENRTHTHTMAHTHTFSGTTSGPSATVQKNNTDQDDVATADHTHTFSSTTGGSSSANTGNQSTTIAPYLQYLLCKKN